MSNEHHGQVASNSVRHPFEHRGSSDYSATYAAASDSGPAHFLPQTCSRLEVNLSLRQCAQTTKLRFAVDTLGVPRQFTVV